MFVAVDKCRLLYACCLFPALAAPRIEEDAPAAGRKSQQCKCSTRTVLNAAWGLIALQSKVDTLMQNGFLE